MSHKLILFVVLGAAATASLALAYGALRWRSMTHSLRSRLEAARVRATAAKVYHSDELAGLPAPVQRYFRRVLQDGQPIVTGARIEQAGTFNLSETDQRWRPFTATQQVVTRRPGFDWDARISLLPGLIVRVHDAYVAGDGSLHASLFGLVPVAKLHGTHELAEGELMRFLAEAAWFPTALLPSQGVRWDPVDDTTANATLTDGTTRVTLTFHFAADGSIASVTGLRGRTTAGGVTPTPWEGRWSRCEIRAGMLIPLEGEVAWHLPGGIHPYWRGRITRIAYEFAP